jgi:molybdate transport system substrate-binding protein
LRFFTKSNLLKIGLGSLLLVAMVMSGCSKTRPVELTICAGVGLTDIVTEINELFMQENPEIQIIANFAAAGTLQKQIEQGAPADILFSPGVKQLDALQSDGFIINETRQDILINKVVLIIPADSVLNITSFNDLLNDDVRNIAIGDPEFVPAGTYAVQALDFFGITEQLQTKLILCHDVRQVLNYVETGDVDAGIVYATDTVITDKVKVIAEGPAEVNSKIVYPIAVIKASNNVEAAKAYIAFLFTDKAKAIFEKYGFTTVSS